MKKQMICALVLVLLFFSVVSGCKVKQKAVKESSLQEKSKTELTASGTTLKSESSTASTIDTTKTTTKAIEKSSSKKTTEVTIELDSGKKVFSDTSGDFSLGKMVNAALSHAKSIRIRVEEEQNKDSQSEVSENRHISKSDQADKKESSQTNLSAKKQKQRKIKAKDVAVTKDSTLGINWVRLWPLLVIALLVAAFILYRKLK